MPNRIKKSRFGKLWVKIAAKIIVFLQNQDYYRGLKYGRFHTIRMVCHYPHMLYIASPNSTTLSCKLNWRHYVEILKGDAPLETGFYVILIKFCLCILFPKCTINAAFRKQNSIPYFLGQLIYVALCQCIILASSDVARKQH